MLRTTSTVHVTPSYARAVALFEHAKRLGVISKILFGAGKRFKTIDKIEQLARLESGISVSGTYNPSLSAAKKIAAVFSGKS